MEASGIRVHDSRAGDGPSRTVRPECHAETAWTTELAVGKATPLLHVVPAAFAPGAPTA